ncbi:MAG: hypothetical protein Q4C24_01065 [Candidatus Saccharibacteria bacterium]|uniref:DUF4145 domain-containing protein n=1 Tax=Candidatus Nanosyncoccus alces TaxID=2171997 RepID=A0ABY0FLB5_9BACT|nr:hypothetical protein [Candidatus Nanosyncoccus alces]MDO4398866.1 hypothetical protein [Candidatus Saccharibacteria bacterium]RYC74542.1 hypothetical protein G3RUM_00699 [Candidatus Nanosyncoccus alces]
MDGGVVIFILAILIVAVFIFVAILLTGKRGHHFNMEAYQARFLAIENKLNKENSATFMTTIIEADKLLDKALMEMGVPGKTMGDRLKRSGDKFTDVNAVWRAHKLRNAIAHEADLEIGYKQAANAIAIYKQALKDLGAI